MRYLRKTFRGVEIATYHLENKNGQQIRVSGAIHIAHPSFWDSANAMLKRSEDEGFALHLEAVKPIPKDAVVTQDQKEILDRLSHYMASQGVVSKYTGLAHQKDALRDLYLRVGSVDINVLELLDGVDIDKLKDSKPEELEKSLEELQTLKPGLPGKILLFMLRNIETISRILKSTNVPSKSFLDMEFILDYRNEYAVAMAIESGQNVHLFWGGAHLKGMMALLKAEGFKVKKTEWTVIIPRGYQVPDLPVLTKPVVAH